MVAAVAHYRNIWNGIWDRMERRPIAHLISLYIFCIIVFLITVPLPRVDGQLVGSDGVYYYAYLPTLLLDHDLDFTNQYAKLLPGVSLKAAGITKSGAPANKFAIGSAILWIPFFLIGHLLAIALNAIGYAIPLDGIGYIYQVPTLLGSLSYGFAGLLLIYRSCCRFFSKSSSVSATVLIWLATNVIYYMIAEPSMSHTCSLFAVALFLELWLGFRPMPTLRQWVLLGLAGGLIALVRQPDATWVAIPIVDALLVFGTKWKANLGRYLQGFIVFGTTALVVFIPQMAVWRALYGTATRGGYIHGYHSFHWLGSKMLRVLFSTRHGLYLWHPLLLFATVGLILLYRKDRYLPFLLGIFFVIQVYLIGAWFGWTGGDAFGGRLFISSLPALALGLAALVEWISEHGARVAASLLGCGLIAWNALFFAQYRLGYIPRSASITFDQLTVGKIAMLKDLAARILAMHR